MVSWRGGRLVVGCRPSTEKRQERWTVNPSYELTGWRVLTAWISNPKSVGWLHHKRETSHPWIRIYKDMRPVTLIYGEPILADGCFLAHFDEE